MEAPSASSPLHATADLLISNGSSSSAVSHADDWSTTTSSVTPSCSSSSSSSSSASLPRDKDDNNIAFGDGNPHAAAAASISGSSMSATFSSSSSAIPAASSSSSTSSSFASSSTSLFDFPSSALSEAMAAINELQITLENEGIPAYRDQFDADIAKETLTVGLLSTDELATRRHELEEERAREETERFRAHEARLQRVRDAEIAARKRIEAARKALETTILLGSSDARTAAAAREAALYRTYERAFEQMRARIKSYNAIVKARYGLLQTLPGGGSSSDSMNHATSSASTALSLLNRQLKIDWRKIPQPLEFRISRIRAIRNKLPDGLYILMVSLYNRLGGSPMKWSAFPLGYGGTTGGSGRGGSQGAGDDNTDDRPTATTAVRHRGRFYDTDMIFHQCIYGTAASALDIRPAHVWVFELFLLGGRTQPMDRVVGWGALPACTSDLRPIAGKYKIPLLRGEMNPDIDRYTMIEKTINSNLDMWLANLYVEAVLLPRITTVMELSNSKNKNTSTTNSVVVSETKPQGGNSYSSMVMTSGLDKVTGAIGLRRRHVRDWDVELSYTSSLLRIRNEYRVAKGIPKLTQSSTPTPTTTTGGGTANSTSSSAAAASPFLLLLQQKPPKAERIAADPIALALGKNASSSSKPKTAFGRGSREDDRHIRYVGDFEDDDDENDALNYNEKSRKNTIGASAKGDDVYGDDDDNDSSNDEDDDENYYAEDANKRADRKGRWDNGGAGAALLPIGQTEDDDTSNSDFKFDGGIASTSMPISAALQAGLMGGNTGAFAAAATITSAQRGVVFASKLGAASAMSGATSASSSSSSSASSQKQQPLPPQQQQQQQRKGLSQSIFSFAVNKDNGAPNSSMTGKGHLRDSLRKLAFVKYELGGDLQRSNILTVEFWMQLGQLVLALWLRAYIHYLGQYAYLRALKIPVYDLTPLVYAMDVRYVPDALPNEIEIGTVIVGPLAVLAVFLLGCFLSFVSQILMGRFPTPLSHFLAFFGMASAMDPVLIAFVDAVAGRFDCTSRYPACAIDTSSAACGCVEGDAWRLSRRFYRLEGSGVPGAVLTVTLYAILISIGALAVYLYLLHLHLNGRMLDTFRRVEGTEDRFQLPSDFEVSSSELLSIINRASKWKGLKGSHRRVAVCEYILTDPADPSWREVTTHLIIYTIAGAGVLRPSGAAGGGGNGGATSSGSSSSSSSSSSMASAAASISGGGGAATATVAPMPQVSTTAVSGNADATALTIAADTSSAQQPLLTTQSSSSSATQAHTPSSLPAAGVPTGPTTRELYRHFLRTPDGTILEVFGTLFDRYLGSGLSAAAPPTLAAVLLAQANTLDANDESAIKKEFFGDM